MFGSWKARPRPGPDTVVQTSCRVEHQQQLHQNQQHQHQQVHQSVQPKTSIVSSKIQFFQSQFKQQVSSQSANNKSNCNANTAQTNFNVKIAPTGQHNIKQPQLGQLLEQRCNANTVNAPHYPTSNKSQNNQQQQQLSPDYDQQNNSNTPHYSTSSKSKNNKQQQQQQQQQHQQKQEPQQKQQNDENSSDDGLGCYLSEEEELFVAVQERRLHWSAGQAMKDLPGWLKTASLQRCEKTPPLPRTKVPCHAENQNISSRVQIQNIAPRNEIQNQNISSAPTPPPRLRRSQSRESSTFGSSQLSVAFCSSNSASHSPTATPRRHRKQQLTKGINLMRRSVSLQYFDSELAEKPVLPPKLSIGSRGSLNDSEKVGRCKIRNPGLRFTKV